MTSVILVDGDRRHPVHYSLSRLEQQIEVEGVRYYRVSPVEGYESLAAYAQLPSSGVCHPPASLAKAPDAPAPAPQRVAEPEPVAHPPAKKAKAAKGRR